jgi:hypothetical protein
MTRGAFAHDLAPMPPAWIMGRIMMKAGREMRAKKANDNYEKMK